jgi:hypothetical protein
MTLVDAGIQGRDAGTLGCYRLGATEKEIATAIVTVIGECFNL